MKDMVNHPAHYTQWRTGEVVRLTRLLPFSAGNAVKYILRPEKGNYAEDLRKAVWYCRDLMSNPPPRMLYSALDEHEVRRLFFGFAGDLNAAGYKTAALSLIAISSAVLSFDYTSPTCVCWLTSAETQLSALAASLENEKREP